MVIICLACRERHEADEDGVAFLVLGNDAREAESHSYNSSHLYCVYLKQMSVELNAGDFLNVCKL